MCIRDSYLGDFPAYEVLAEVNRNGQYACPIYVGKAVDVYKRQTLAFIP